MPPPFPRGLLPGDELWYEEKTTTVSITSTTSSAPTAIFAGAALVFDGSTRICIEVYTPVLDVSSGGFIDIVISDNGTALGDMNDAHAGAALDQGGTFRRFLTPSAGAHTFSIGAWKSGTATFYGGPGNAAGAYMPAYFRITRA